MEIKTNSPFVVQRTLAILSLLLGLFLLIFMITQEGEPGALPLLLLIGGTVWNIVLHRKIKNTRIKS